VRVKDVRESAGPAGLQHDSASPPEWKPSAIMRFTSSGLTPSNGEGVRKLMSRMTERFPEDVD